MNLLDLFFNSLFHHRPVMQDVINNAGGNVKSDTLLPLAENLVHCVRSFISLRIEIIKM